MAAHLNKTADLAAPTLGELILVIAAGIIIIFVLLAVLSALSPTLGSFGCSLNVRIYGAFVGNTSGAITPPIFLCNQYQEPVKINAADFSKCPGLADFCKEPKLPPEILTECYRQCARIQVDKLTDACWQMGGSGKIHLWNLGQRFGAVGADVARRFTAGFIFTMAVVAYWTEIGFFYSPHDIENSVNKAFGDIISTRAVILKCYKFQIVNPVKDPTGKDINYIDGSFGMDWAYVLNESSAPVQLYTKCKNSKDNPICSYGGLGVTHVREYPFNNKTNLFGETINYPSSIDEYNGQAALFAFLNYNASPNQVCYISYYNDGGPGDAKFVVRSCNGWGAAAQWQSYLN